MPFGRVFGNFLSRQQKKNLGLSKPDTESELDQDLGYDGGITKADLSDDVREAAIKREHDRLGRDDSSSAPKR